MFGPVSIETNLRIASMRQMHCAIEHIERGDYECAITLAAAAENMLPEPEKPYFRGRVKKLSESEQIKAAGDAVGPNDYYVCQGPALCVHDRRRADERGVRSQHRAIRRRRSH